MKNKTTDQVDEIKLRCELDFEFFIETVQPKRVLGNIHRELIRWLTRSDALSHQLVLLPRDHMKSSIAGLYAAWEIVRNPAIRILYISSTANLATKQLKFIKDILTSDAVRKYWPDLVEREEAKREKWTEKEICIDHPKRKEEMIRDPTVFTAGLTSNIVGMHCDITILDDVVVQGNAYIDEGRQTVKEQYGYLSSVGSGAVRELAVGTRYHPLDLYNDLMDIKVDKSDKYGALLSSEPLFEVFERQVESSGDGFGEFLWPRQQRSDGKWFGFDADILSKKRASYLNKTHFRAQYYNDPHDIDSSPIKRDLFQYYDPNYLSCRDGRWYFKGERLNVVASVDFAYSTGKKSDFTSIVVIGVDSQFNYYILEISRFKTDMISEYYNHILRLHQTWGFRKLRAEITAGQQVIVKDLKDSYIRKNGLALVIDEYRPSRWQGSKDERIMAVLQPKYANGQIWHYRTGNCQVLEEELIYANPAHDDVKDALASAVDFGIAPSSFFNLKKDYVPTFNFHSKYGGVV